MDFSDITTALTPEVAKVGVALMAIAAIKVMPGVVRWGTSMVISWFR